MQQEISICEYSGLPSLSSYNTQKTKVMNKKEIRNAINKAVYIYAESLGYMVSDDNDGSYVTFSKPDYNKVEDSIDYMRSYHETCVMNWACDQIKEDAKLIDAFAKAQKSIYEKQN